RTINPPDHPSEDNRQLQEGNHLEGEQPDREGDFVLQLPPQNGHHLKGRITQLQNGQLPTWQDNNLFITRTLYIGNVLYTISNSKVQVNSLSDLSEIGSVSLA